MIKRLGFAAISAAFILATPLASSAATFGSNLIVNGDAEADVGSNGYATVPVTGFTTSGGFTVVSYAAGGGFPVAGDAGVSAGGANFFAGGDNTADSMASQLIDVSLGASVIDLGGATYDLSALIGGYASQGDYAALSISFLNAASGALGSASIVPVTPTDRGNLTGLLFRQTTGLVPIGTRFIDVNLEMVRQAGSYDDGYADNLSLVLAGNAPVAGGVPEPSSWLLMSLGVGAIGLALRRRRSAAPVAA